MISIKICQKKKKQKKKKKKNERIGIKTWKKLKYFCTI